MLLKSLEIQGFKTFPDKTTLSFDNGITAVVGPNGSGKSNISDAVRWVLGEQSIRALRCTKMEDVIFNGTPTRKAKGFAEVTLNIDNISRQLPFDGDNVAVTRRYYRSGDSEYLINKVSVRLRDINELFMDTGLGRDGYSIIGQGKIDSIVAARSEDRREIFDEAAGISRFRYRKEESERRLNQVEDNLLRLHDILKELENRVGPLKEQAEKAGQFLEYASEKRILEISLWLSTLEKSGQVLREHDDKITIAKNQHNDIEQELGKIDADVEVNFRNSSSSTSKVDEIRQETARVEESATKKDGEISVLQNDIFHNNEGIERIKREIEQNAFSKNSMDNEIEEKNNLIDEKTQYINEKNTQLEACTEQLGQVRKSMDEISNKIDEHSRQIADLTTETLQAKVDEMTAVSSISEIELRLSTVDKTLVAKQAQTLELKCTVEDYAKMLSDIDERMKLLANSVRSYENSLSSCRKSMETIKQQSDTLNLDAQERSRRAHLLEELERNLEGFSYSVKIVMKEVKHGTISGIHGPVSRLIKVQPKYTVAIETALGAAMQNIVVDNEKDAKHAIQLLKQRNSGRATFLPLSIIKGKFLREDGLDDCSGFVGIAGKLCGCDEKYNGILNSLLGRIVVAEDLDSAVAIAKHYGYRFRIVTLDGQVINAGGSLTGGSFVKNSGILNRATEIERISSQATELKSRAEKAAEELKIAVKAVSDSEAVLQTSKVEFATTQEKSFKIDAEHRRALADFATVTNDVRVLKAEKETADTRLNNQKRSQKIANAQSQEIIGKRLALEDKLNQISGRRGELSQASDKLSDNLQELRIVNLSAKKDIESLRAGINDIEQRKINHKGKATELGCEIKKVQFATVKLTEQIDNLKEQAETLRETSLKSDEKILKLNEKRMEYERCSVELRAKEREKSIEKEKIGHDLARLEERKDNLQKEYDEIISRLWEEYELTRREAEAVGSKIENVAKSQMRLIELKNKIKALGSVNVAAVEEYKEVSQRYEFMTKQVADVEKSRGDLKKLIDELTNQMQDLFLKRFRQINEHFKQTFSELFGGGTASLTMSIPDDILNSGIDIFVQPPGKIVTHLESLSGGEKALVSIALYFSIMKVNPPPFCVLDEIEAALDDVNVDRFATYLRRMNKNTQFIIITHRRGSMEEADVLYGITMQDEGVSKLLVLQVSEIEAKLGIKK